MQEILVLEDDRELAEGIEMALISDDLSFTLCGTVMEAKKMQREKRFDLLILDINLPDGSGLELCREIRRGSKVPIMLLTARDMELDIVKGLECGADDYITKPFNPIEVSARVKSQLRRYMQLGGGTVRPDVIRVGGIELDDKEKRVMLDGELVALTPTEYDILKLLLEHLGQVFSPREIYRKVWKDAPFGSENTVAVHIRHLREKIEIDPAEPRYLKVVWGQGYKLEKGMRT